MNKSTKTRVLIIGGGFGGTKAALELAKAHDCEVTLVSDHSNFRYYPALYHVATGGKMAGAHIKLTNILGDTNVKFVEATVTKLHRDKKQIETADKKKLPYDILVLGLGNITNYFGIKGLDKHSFGIKSAEEVERFRTHIHQQFIKNGCPDLNYVIIGGGPTGVELAGELPAYLKAVMKRHGVEDCPVSVKLVEAMPQILPRSSKEVADKVSERLKHLGVDIMVSTAVQGQTADTLMANDKPLESRTVVWTAGVTNNPFFKENDFKMTERGKVEVDDYLQAEPDIFVIGDNANTQYSGMAQTALHNGHFVAENIERKLEGKEMKKYEAKAPISVIPVGPYWASVQWGKQTVNGFLGWVLRSAADLIGFHDLQSWPKAGSQWMTSMQSEELGCPDCDKK